MAQYATLKASIQNVIKQNGNNEITGDLLQQALMSMVNSLGVGYQYVGIATPATNPGTPDQNVYYVGGPGTYNNFGDEIVVTPGTICVFKWNGSWSREILNTTDKNILNVNEINNQSAAFSNAYSARSSVPNSMRKNGTIITYKLASGWRIEQFIGSNVITDWPNEISWKNYENELDIIKSVLGIEVIELSGDVLDGVFVGQYGVLESNAAFKTIRYDVSNYKSGSLVGVTPLSGNQYVTTLGLLKGSSKVYQGPLTSVSSFDVVNLAGKDVDYCYISMGSTDDVNLAYLKLIRMSDVVTTEDLENIVNDEQTVETVLIPDDGFVNDNKFIEANGTIITNSGYKTTDFIPVGQIKSVEVYAVMRNIYGGGIVFYDAYKNHISAVYNVEQPDYDNNVYYELLPSQIPANAVYMKVQGRKNTSQSASVTIHYDKEKFVSGLIEKPATSLLLSNSVASLAAGSSLSIDNTPQTKNGYSICASMKIGTMGKIRISKGVNAWGAGIIEIDDTNIYVYDPRTPETLMATIPHNLTISDFLIVQIVLKLNAAVTTPSKLYYASVKLTTNASQMFEAQNNVAWLGCSGNVQLQSVSGNYTDVQICMNGEAFKKDIWIFGDSYTDMWCNFLTPLGAYNCMIDGKSGRASIEAFTSLNNALKMGKPKTILWAMGMNDGDSNGQVNANWLNTFNSVAALCAELGIELLPFTIPNTPVVTNYYKNQIVRSSGYKYIDVANIVGANEIGSSWYSGLLSGDDVHPDDRGSMVIANYIVSMVPCLTNY